LDLFNILISVVLAVGVNLLLSKYLPSYFSEKGKNTATKEDIEEITQKVEGIKASLSKEEKILEKRRVIYEQIVSLLRIFIEGHGNSNEQQEKFYEAYASAWLWTPDSILISLNKFIEHQIQCASSPTPMCQVASKILYANIILEMRRDVGFIATDVTSENYVFATFGR